MNSDSFNPDIAGMQQREKQRRAEAQRVADGQQQLSALNRVTAFFANGRTRFAIGIILLLMSVFLLLSFLSFFTSGLADQSMVQTNGVFENARNAAALRNIGASLGASWSQFFIADGVGIAAFIIVVWCFTIGMRLLSKKKKKVLFFSYTLVTLLSIFTLALVLGAVTYKSSFTFFPLGGAFGYHANKWLLGLTGIPGMIALNMLAVMVWFFACFNTLNSMWRRTSSVISERSKHLKTDNSPEGDEGTELSPFIGEQQADNATPPQPADETSKRKGIFGRSREQKDKDKKDRRKTEQEKPTGAPATMSEIEKGNPEHTNPGDPTGEFVRYRFPSLELLADRSMRTDSVDEVEQEANKKRITETLNNYGIQIKQIEVHVGPTVTLFEIIPVDGTRVSKIKNLEDDIALSLAALGIRIIAPMPGRGTIGIEVPNREPQTVPIRQVLSSRAFQETKAKLPMCLGCTVSNEVFIADLTKLPHLLVAGATGKGKSVGLNTIIASLLYKLGPSELKLVLVDPKRVEFSIYADIEQYFFAKVEGDDNAIVTDTSKVVHTLNCLVQEMEDRYKVLEEVKMRNVGDYNAAWRRELRNVRDEHGELKYRYMPFIVAIIDEFSDMIMTAGKEVETPIVRIAQKARAVGIHMIIATQRPSAKVITGLIKGNFPGRIAFAVSSRVDSQIILDLSGAQRLLGKGDMLFKDDNGLVRLQCPFIDTPEIVRICDFIKEQEDNDRDLAHQEPYILPEYVSMDDASGGGGADASNVKDRDPLFEEAARWIVQGEYASTSSLQRRYEIGYNRAGRLMDQMEAAGIVGPASGGKPRKVLVTPMDIEQLFP